jgi:glycosyltransferase involved in cell wall biosynthesis
MGRTPRWVSWTDRRTVMAGLDEPLVSVIVPTYDRPLLLRRSLESVAAQTFQDWECIIVDDASPTRSAEGVVTAFSDPRFRLVRRDANGGPSAALNTGLEEASARYVCFNADDDELHPHFLQEGVTAMEGAEPDVIAAEAGLDFTDEKRQWTRPARLPQLTRESLLELNESVAVVGILFRRDAVTDLRFDEEMRAWEDMDFILRLPPGRILALTSAGVLVHDHDGDRLSSSPEMIRGLEHLLDKLDAEPANKRLRGRWAFVLAVLHARQGDMSRSRDELRRSLRLAPLNPRTAVLVALGIVSTRLGDRAFLHYLRLSDSRSAERREPVTATE